MAVGNQPQYIFFRVVQFSEDGREEMVWTAPVWFQSQAEEVVITPPGGGTGPGGGTTPPPATDRAVASRRSNTFHVSIRCFDAQRISPQKVVRGVRGIT